MPSNFPSRQPDPDLRDISASDFLVVYRPSDLAHPDGLRILTEVSGDLGHHLFCAVRATRLWGSCCADDRVKLFAPGGHLPRLDLYHGIKGALLTIERMVVAGGSADRDEVALACQHVAAWAADHGWFGTALEFAAAAACVRPEHAVDAIRAGQAARRAAAYPLALAWLQRGLELAETQSDWHAYTLALSALGNVYVQRGNYPRAREAHARCLACASHHGLAELEGDANHDLMGIAIEVEDLAGAKAFAQASLRAYGASHPKIPRLAHDFAILLTLMGHFGSALCVQHALLPFYRRPVDQIIVWGDIARAAGEAGRRDEFEQAREAVWDIIAHHRPEDYMGRALLDVALGASALRAWMHAARAAAAALEIATKRQEGKIAITAEQILEGIERARALELKPTGAAVLEDESRPLAAEFVRALSLSTAGR
ncbi:MAG TPA: hypothetical protein VF615_25785 [Longimicrobiaceae bacterium]